jgi:hypothetical protein
MAITKRFGVFFSEEAIIKCSSYNNTLVKEFGWQGVDSLVKIEI